MPEYSALPGFHERHLRRRENNTLFPEERRCVTQFDIHTAQRLDREAFTDFMTRFRSVVDRAVNLESNVDSQVILDLKQDLDKSYEECAGLAGDQSDIKDAIRKLIATIMQAIWTGAEQDPQAQSKLRDEETAREMHFQLLETPLVADLLNPQSPIQENELLPTFLSASEDELGKALQIFRPEQLGSLCSDGKALLSSLENEEIDLGIAKERLLQIETFIMHLAETESVN